MITEEEATLGFDALAPNHAFKEDFLASLPRMAWIEPASKNRIAHFLGQLSHESANFTVLNENLYYTTHERLMQVWPSRFKTASLAKQYVKEPEKLANYVYGGRMGNTEPGDGWKFRGRGFIQLTGKSQYEMVQRITGINLLEHPEKAMHPEYSFIIGWLYMHVRTYRGKTLLGWADLNNVEAVTRGINGGLHGLADRRRRTTKALLAMNSLAYYPVLREGSDGPYAALAQTQLNKHGYLLVVDGQYGPRTRTAVVAFQRKHSLEPDGVVGMNTWRSLMGEAP